MTKVTTRFNKNMYVHNIAYVKVNNLFTKWFNVWSGARQGDNLSPILFNLYINKLAIELNDLNYGVDIGGKKACLLLYDDHIVIIAENENNIQTQLDCINNNIINGVRNGVSTLTTLNLM